TLLAYSTLGITDEQTDTPPGRNADRPGPAPEEHQAGNVDRHAAGARRRDHRRDHGRDRLAVAHGARCNGRCAEEEAWSRGQFREGRRTWAGLPVARSLTPQLSSCHGRRPFGAAVASWARRIRMASNTRRNVKLRAIDTTVKIAPMAMLSVSVVDNPNSGNTSICVTTAMP